MQSSEMSFWEHVEELRKVFLRCLFVIFILFIFSFSYCDLIFDFLKSPLESWAYDPSRQGVQSGIVQTRWASNDTDKEKVFDLPANSLPLFETAGVKILEEKRLLLGPGTSITYQVKDSNLPLILTGPTEGFLATFKICFWSSLAASSPIWLFFVLRFIHPALEQKQKRLLFPFVFWSCLFFGLGGLFALQVTIPLANAYFAGFNLPLGTNLWSLGGYLDYTLMLVVGNGIGFELLVVLGFLVHHGKIDAQQLSSKRRHAVVVSLILGALLTPPDVLTQIVMALPLIVFYELAILYARIRGPTASS